jgi:hypothetical protein
MTIRKSLIKWTIKGQLHQRYIFNFLIKPEVLVEKLPVDWLRPQIINGWSVVSFCILDIKKVTVSPIPNFFGFETTSCAYRIGAIDASGSGNQSTVYVTDRNADLALVTKFAPFLLADAIPFVKCSISHEPSGLVRIQANYADGQGLFAASAQPGEFKSDLFHDLEGFKAFIKGGVSSYTPSIYEGQMTRVDLHKTDTLYEPYVGEVDFSWLDGVWKDADLKLDSIVKASGGEYRWKYQGLASFK